MHKIKLGLLFLVTTIITPISYATQVDHKELFKNKEGCFLLYDVNKNQMATYYTTNPSRCNQRIAPNSTFKVPLSIMAFDQKLITQDTIFVWDGKHRWLSEWNKNQTPVTWEQYSVLWVSQQLTPKLGINRIKDYLAKFNYGNQDFSGDVGENNGLTNAWLSSSLKISAVEQLNFLRKMLSYKLSVNKSSIDATEHNIYLGKERINNKEWQLYGKTGSGRSRNNASNKMTKLRDGWFIGYVKYHKQVYIIITNLTDKVAPAENDTQMGGPLAKAITLQILKGQAL